MSGAATGGLRGVVVDPSGAAMAGVRVTPDRGAPAVSDALGRFELQGLEPGTHRIKFNTAGFEIRTMETVVAGGIVYGVGRVTMSLGLLIGDVEVSKLEPAPMPGTLPMGGVAGVVTGKNGARLTARIQLHRVGGGPSMLALAGTNGRFVIENVLPGDYDLEVAMPDYRTKKMPVTVGSGRLNLAAIVLEAEP